MQRGSALPLPMPKSTGVLRSAGPLGSSSSEHRRTPELGSLAKVLRDPDTTVASAGVELSHERGAPVASAGVEAAGAREGGGGLGARCEDAGYRGTSQWVNTEPFPVSAYVGSSKNLKDLEGKGYEDAGYRSTSQWGDPLGPSGPLGSLGFSSSQHRRAPKRRYEEALSLYEEAARGNPRSRAREDARETSWYAFTHPNRTTHHPLCTSLCTGELNAIRKQKCVLCSPFYGTACRWAMVG